MGDVRVANIVVNVRLFLFTFLTWFLFSFFDKHVNNQTDCRIALEKLRKYGSVLVYSFSCMMRILSNCPAKVSVFHLLDNLLDELISSKLLNHAVHASSGTRTSLLLTAKANLCAQRKSLNYFFLSPFFCICRHMYHTSQWGHNHFLNF